MYVRPIFFTLKHNHNHNHFESAGNIEMSVRKLEQSIFGSWASYITVQTVKQQFIYWFWWRNIFLFFQLMYSDLLSLNSCDFWTLALNRWLNLLLK